MTDEILYTRYASIKYDASVSSEVDDIYGALADLTLSAVNTAGTKYVDLQSSFGKTVFKLIFPVNVPSSKGTLAITPKSNSLHKGNNLSSGA